MHEQSRVKIDNELLLNPSHFSWHVTEGVNKFYELRMLILPTNIKKQEKVVLGQYNLRAGKLGRIKVTAIE